jgi:hypothetical protein
MRSLLFIQKRKEQAKHAKMEMTEIRGPAGATGT